jgi:hypothetical protein
LLCWSTYHAGAPSDCPIGNDSSLLRFIRQLPRFGYTVGSRGSEATN